MDSLRLPLEQLVLQLIRQTYGVRWLLGLFFRTLHVTSSTSANMLDVLARSQGCVGNHVVVGALGGLESRGANVTATAATGAEGAVAVCADFSRASDFAIYVAV